MKPLKRNTGHNSGASDLGGVALAGFMIGAILAVAGIAQLHPVLSHIAEAFGAKPALNPVQTLLIGAALIASGIGLFAWPGRARTKRR
jgi:hypothetical protein